jgi:hypothetical protein
MTPADEMKLLAMRDYLLKLANNASRYDITITFLVNRVLSWLS